METLRESLPNPENTTESKSIAPSLADGCLRLREGGLVFQARRMPMGVRWVNEIDPTLRIWLRDLVTGRKPWPFFLYGLPGRGKSCAALCLTDYVGGWFIGADQFVDRMRAADLGKLMTGGASGICDPWPVSMEDAWQDWTEAPLVVLDEIGLNEAPTAFHKRIIKEAIDRRFELQREPKPTVFISNLNLTGISQRLNDQIASRLAACGSLFELTGPDRRPNVEEQS